MALVLQVLINGLVLSGFYVIVTIGLTLIFGVMRVFNFAHGELYMVGAYIVWLLYAEASWPFFVAVLVSGALVAGIGIIFERGIFYPLRENPMAGFIGSVGIVFILQVFVGQVWGLGANKPVPPVYPQVLEFYSVHLGMQRLIIIPIASALLGGLWFFLQRMKVGQALRACAQDAETASLQGISNSRMRVIAMVLACAFAGVAGGLMAPIATVNPYMGSSIILKAFVVVIVGGVGSIQGTVVAALLLGLLDSSITTMFDSTIANVAALVLMFVLLSVRPRGLLGRE